MAKLGTNLQPTELGKGFLDFAKKFEEDPDAVSDVLALLDDRLPEEKIAEAIEILNAGESIEEMFKALNDLLPANEEEGNEGDEGEKQTWQQLIINAAGYDIGPNIVALLENDRKEVQQRNADTVLGWLEGGMTPQAAYEKILEAANQRHARNNAGGSATQAADNGQKAKAKGVPGKSQLDRIMRRVGDFIQGKPRWLIALGGVAVVIVILLICGSLISFGVTTVMPRPTLSPEALTATAVDEEAETLGEQAPAVVAQATSFPTPEPTATPLPPTPESPLASGCPGGYVTVERFPTKVVVGQKVWKTLDFGEEPASPPIEDKLYRVTPLMGRNDVSVIQMADNAYFAPQDWFPPRDGEKQDCAPLASVPAFNNAFNRLEPEVGAPTTVWDRDWWAMAAWGFAGLLLFAAVAETVVKKQVRTLIWMVAILSVSVLLSNKTQDDGQWLVYLFGLICSLALGDRGALAEVDAAIQRTGQVKLPDEVQELLEAGEGIRQFVTSIDWSRPAVFAGANLFWGVLTPNGSPLHQQFGPLVATGFLGLQCLMFYGLEAWRRNRTGDWGAIGVALVGGLATAVLAYAIPHGSTTQTIAMLVTALIGVVTIVMVGVSSQKAIERDRIPDGLAAFASLALAGLILVVRLFP